MTNMRRAVVAVAAVVWGAAASQAGEDASFAAAGRRGQDAAIASIETLKEQAQETILRDETSDVAVTLDSRTVKCSAADYSEPRLKILIPALAGLTVLNHRNSGEAAPCVAAGVCDGSTGPDIVLGRGEGVERARVRVVLSVKREIAGDACAVTLFERVTTDIRGITFSHVRGEAVGSRAAEDCR